MHPAILLVRRFLFPAICLSCPDDIPADHDAPICSACEHRIETPPPLPPPPGLDSIVAASVFEGSARDLVHGLKYGGKFYLARFMGTRIAECLEAHSKASDLIVPVPLPPLRRLSRGLAGTISKRWGIPTAAGVLRRRTGFPSQTSLGRAQRLENARRSFTTGWVQRPLNGRRVLLIDDVSTSGATLSACAEPLRRAGAKEVRAAVFAWEPLGIIRESDSRSVAS
jgi:predicted amidophosphoribosyltransferase